MADNSAWIPLVKSRVHNDVLVPLTVESSNTESTTTPDDAILQTAIDDAIGLFQLYAKLLPDTENAVHVPIIVTGTLYYLKERKNPATNETARNKFRFACLDLEASITNTSFSTADTISSDPTRGGTVIVRPDSDRSRFASYLPGYGRSTDKEW